jgi:hypothetical protein
MLTRFKRWTKQHKLRQLHSTCRYQSHRNNRLSGKTREVAHFKTRSAMSCRRPKLKKAPVSLEQLEKNARELRVGSGTKKPSREMDLLTNAVLNRRPAMDDQFEEDDDTDSRDQSDEAWK